MTIPEDITRGSMVEAYTRASSNVVPKAPPRSPIACTAKSAANSRREVMLALANDVMMCSNLKTCWWKGGNVLETFLQALKRLAVRNVVVISLDDATHRFVEQCGGARSLRMELPVPKAQQGSRGANMISTLKYGLLEQALRMGFGVLVVDLDLVFLKDPFAHLHRDADVEASTDGFSLGWAKGQLSSVHEKRMGWGAGGLYLQHFTLNVGCAFLRPTAASIGLMRRVSARLAGAPAWDQQARRSAVGGEKRPRRDAPAPPSSPAPQVFNEEAFYLSHGAYNGSQVATARRRAPPPPPPPHELANPARRCAGGRARDAVRRMGQLEGLLLQRPHSLLSRRAAALGRRHARHGAHELSPRQAQAHAVRVGAVRRREARCVRQTPPGKRVTQAVLT